MSHRFRFSRTLLASVLFCLCAGFQDEPVQPQANHEGFEFLRQPVLGLAIARNAELDLYRLISVEVPSKYLRVGSLEECEQTLAKVLRERHGKGRINLRLPTLGGLQFWTDVFWFADWRIQENVYTGHFRLLDPRETRVAWGTREACRARFELERTQRGLEVESDKLVVLLHGLGRSRTVFEDLRTSLRLAGYAVASVGYPSTRRSIAEHANGLNELLNGLDDTTQISFVTHSLGGIVVRVALSNDEIQWRQRIALGRVVMLAPPNQGSELARELSSFSPFRAIAGPAGEELQRELAGIPAPPCPFGIVAASRESKDGINPLVSGDDDGIVSVEETKLAGAADFLEVKSLHTIVMNNPIVIDATLRFLASGRFREAPRKPIR